jgi:hypothetical protein
MRQASCEGQRKLRRKVTVRRKKAAHAIQEMAPKCELADPAEQIAQDVVIP